VSDLAVETREDEEIGDAPPPVAPAQPQKRGPGRPPKAITDGIEKDTRTIVDWIRGLGNLGPNFKIQIFRLEPAHYMGTKLSGFIRSFDSMVDEEQVKQMYGGGKYQVKLLLPDDTGRYVVRKYHNFEISGPPRMETDPNREPPPAAPKEESSVAMKAMEVLSSQVSRLSQDGPSRGHGIDADAITRAVAASTAPMQATIDMLTRELGAARSAATEARNAPPDPVRDRILEKVMSDDSSRMESLRMAHAAEVNTLKQSMIDLEQRLRDKHEREISELRSDHKALLDRIERQHERELADLKRSYETQIQILRDAHTREVNSLTMVSTTTKAVGDGEMGRLSRENSELKAEVKALREKKEKPLLEQLKEIDEIKEILGSDDDGKEKTTFEKVIEAVGNSKAALKVIGKFAGEEPPPPTQPQLPPPHVPFTGQDGQLYVHDGMGNVAPVRRRMKRRAPPPMPPPPPPPAPPDASPEVQAQHAAMAEAHTKQVQEMTVAQAVAKIDRDQVAAAVTYLESAFRGGQDAQVVAQSLRSQGLVPEPVLQFVRDQGVDVLLEKVARLEASSAFVKQDGRNWIRKVAKALLE
jgi:hypothetical protein